MATTQGPIPPGTPSPRPVKFIGLAYSTSGNVSIDLLYNNNQIFSGQVPTINVPTLPLAPDPADTWQEITQFESDTSTNGLVPITLINVGTSGDFYINNFTMPTCFYWTDDEGVEWLVSNPSTDPMFISPNVNTIETDGKEDPKINGNSVAYLRTPDQVEKYTSVDGIGEWAFKVSPGETFTCNFNVDLNVLLVPCPF